METLAPAMWRRHSCLPRPHSSGRWSGVYSASGGDTPPRAQKFEVAKKRRDECLRHIARYHR